MTPALAAMLALPLAYAGMAGLCLAMERHDKQVWGRASPPLRRRVCRMLGWGLLLLSAGACVRGWGAALGAVAWFGMLSAASLLLVWLLPYRPRLAASLALAAGLCALPAILM